MISICVSNELIKQGGETLDMYGRIFLNTVIKNGIYPEIGNEGKCVIVHKGGDNMCMKNRRPLTIANGFQHLLSMRHTDKMSAVVEREQLLGQEQFGFRKNRSTLDALFVLNTVIQKSRNSGKKLSIGFLDIKKARR